MVVVTALAIERGATTWTDDEVEVEEALAGNDRAGQARQLCPQLVAELFELTRAGAFAFDARRAVAGRLLERGHLLTQADDIGRDLRRLRQCLAVGDDRRVAGAGVG